MTPLDWIVGIGLAAAAWGALCFAGIRKARRLARDLRELRRAAERAAGEL